MKYVDVILPLKLPWCPVYASEDNVMAGDRVRVKFSGREYDGVVWHTDVMTSVNPEKVSPVSTADTGLIRITARELRFWEFISGYYLCSIGEVYKTAYPDVRIRSERVVLAQKERAESSRIRRLAVMEHRVAALQERLTAKRAALAERLDKELTSTRIKKDNGIADNLKAGILKLESELQSALNTLEVEALPCTSTESTRPVTDSTQTPSKPLVLVSSDRIDFYISAIKDALDSGRQVLVLAPEKAFTGRLTNEIGKNFPGLVHSFSSDDTALNRRKVADKSRTDVIIIIGTRSALFLPYRNLGLIIIDEEQDTFYKQAEPNPRYQGRDAAIMLASIHGADAILGTASPSLETWYNCSTGKYHMQYGLVCSSATTLDINAERRKNGMLGAVSRKLVQAILRTPGPSVVIRGWERPEELDFEKLCPGRAVRVMTMQEFKREGAGDATLIGILQADAFVSKNDFRADERAAQLVAQMSSMVRELFIQTSVPERFSGIRSTSDLLNERKAFGYPPFSKIVEVTVRDRYESRLSYVCSRLSAIPDAHETVTSPDERKFRFFLHRDASLAAKKRDIADAVARIQKDCCFPGHITIDVDPQ